MQLLSVSVVHLVPIATANKTYCHWWPNLALQAYCFQTGILNRELWNGQNNSNYGYELIVQTFAPVLPRMMALGSMARR